MKFVKSNRKFSVGIKKKIVLKDVGSIFLQNDENITLKNFDNKNEYDICKKNWGFYATPSLNKRLRKFGYKAALVKNKNLFTFSILIVDVKKKNIFFKYISDQNMILLCWLDLCNLKKIEKLFLKN